METLNCAQSKKFRHNLSNSYYHNVSRASRVQQIGIDYTLPNYGRRSASAASITHAHHSLWQERGSARTPLSCIGVERKRSAKGRICSIALAIASFVVLILVLGIAGLALYMSISQNEPPNNAFLTFSCSAKVLRGDRFIGVLQEKAQKYKRQFETLYQKSLLGSAFISCEIDNFGKDTFTIYFRLIFNRRKLATNLTNIEAALKDVILNDALSKAQVFRNIRFDPRYLHIKRISETNETPFFSSTITSTTNKPQNIKKTKTGAAVKVSNVNNKPTAPSVTSPKTNIFIKDEPEINEDGLPVIQGSFKISKTEADIIQKKGEVSTAKPKVQEKITTMSIRKTTFKESSVTSGVYKFATSDKRNPTKTSVTPSISTTETSTSSTKLVSTSMSSTTAFIGSPQVVVDEEPWIPIVPDLAAVTETYLPTLSTRKSPFYTSFTNPGLSFHFNQDAHQLGSTGFKGHHIPVNKIPFTNPLTFYASAESSTKFPDIKASTANVYSEEDFIEVDTVKHQPNSIKNISSIFHTLVSSLDGYTNLSQADKPISSFEEEIQEEILGQGQVEVVDVDDEILRSTKAPLVTLLPVRSNSGIGRPFRRRPGDTNTSVENRSFPSELPKVQTISIPPETKVIVGMLNFATEKYESNSHSENNDDIVRYPKMEQDSTKNVNSKNSTTIRNESTINNNFLTPDKLKVLSEISKLTDNKTHYDTEGVISTKAISSSSYLINHSGFKVLTKTLNKLDEVNKNDTKNSAKYGFIAQHNTSDCGKFSVKCGDGKCLPETTKCNQLIDCTDGTDEQGCNCADYLRSQYLLNKICDGIVDCWDFSDENQCEWCSPNQYVCSNSKMCVERSKICDGFNDCPQGDDERQCVTIAANVKGAEEFPYNSEGFLMLRKQGSWGKLCMENIKNVVLTSHVSWEIADLGKAVCKSMTYQNMESVTSIPDDGNSTRYFELAYASQNRSNSSPYFKETLCPSKHVVTVKCQSLECGARPQATRHIARVVGGGNAGLGAWPWQAALYKEGEFQCGATLLSDRWLVSAGHCFYHAQQEHWVARLGALRRGTSLPSPYEQLKTISKIIIHPGYLDFGFINDISLLKMDTPVVFSDYVRPVCLPQQNEVLENGRMCTVVGWGQLFEVGRMFPDTLQEVQVPVISTAECRKRTLLLPLYKITDDMFCAGYERGGRDACLGDSGGPLMCPESNGRWTLYGITSNGYGCARANRPGVYTKVQNYVEWINIHLAGKNEDLTNKTKIVSTCLGHRCPLGECLPESRLCNGFIECSDGSDERNC